MSPVHRHCLMASHGQGMTAGLSRLDRHLLWPAALVVEAQVCSPALLLAARLVAPHTAAQFWIPAALGARQGQ